MGEASRTRQLSAPPEAVWAVLAEFDRIAEALALYERFGSLGGPGLNTIELIEASPPGHE